MPRRSKRQPAQAREVKVNKAISVVAPSQNHLHPSWAFRYADTEGAWKLLADDSSGEFITDVYPKLLSFETQTWNDILVGDKDHHHTIDVEKLNPCAIKRLEDKGYDTQGLQLVSLRLDGTHRLYGFRENGVFSVLWYDRDHGDNDTCVCRSKKRHT